MGRGLIPINSLGSTGYSAPPVPAKQPLQKPATSTLTQNHKKLSYISPCGQARQQRRAEHARNRQTPQHRGPKAGEIAPGCNLALHHSPPSEPASKKHSTPSRHGHRVQTASHLPHSVSTVPGDHKAQHTTRRHLRLRGASFSLSTQPCGRRERAESSNYRAQPDTSARS